MTHQSVCRCLIAGFLSVTASAWGQSSVALGRLDYLAHCASCHGQAATAEGAAQYRITALLKYLAAIQRP